MLILFERKHCPYCVKVRTFLEKNNVKYSSVVSGKGDPSRAIMQKLGGEQQVPFLIDLDKGRWMYESEDIIQYIQEQLSQK